MKYKKELGLFNQPIPDWGNAIINFGKYKGQSMLSVRKSYIIWCYENNKDFIKKRQPEFWEYIEYYYQDLKDDQEETYNCLRPY